MSVSNLKYVTGIYWQLLKSSSEKKYHGILGIMVLGEAYDGTKFKYSPRRKVSPTTHGSYLGTAAIGWETPDKRSIYSERMAGLNLPVDPRHKQRHFKRA